MTPSDLALLATADGAVFEGRSVGAGGMATGELVFNTAMSGYQEVLTDPSYAGQVVVMTSPHIGNYGVNAADEQAARPAAAGLVVRSLSLQESNWRAEGSFSSFLERHGVVALSDLDTRRLTRHIRQNGAMPIAMGAGFDQETLIEAAAATPRMEGQDLASTVSTSRPYSLAPDGDARGLIVAIDLGIKRDILRQLAGRGFEVEVVPASTSSAEVLGYSPTGVFVSNGPGDPEPLTATIGALRELLGRVPLFGICLGHQVLGLALGASTFKLPFGHHGGNHPVKRLSDGRVAITSQNHGFAVDLWSLTTDTAPVRDGLAHQGLLPASVVTDFGTVVSTHQNLNDGTLEGLACLDIPAFGVQYHPEAAPGPQDAVGLFDDFVSLMGA
ncbi:MAG TPA: glutamine-hydrolyzing carbamoyl-phosphate synthase small subunit [Acidimicrobiia bacterium]|nr:glutamine-hydrolyzing carbamoyl-phosphate synthase small subunit [Acidimicrobiia bacterium]